MNRPIDTSEMPPVKRLGARVERDASGELQEKPLGKIREAILSSLGSHQMTRYELWKKARAIRPTLSESAVYEYLRGQRDIGVASAEAMMAAAKLKVTPQKPAGKAAHSQRGQGGMPISGKAKAIVKRGKARQKTGSSTPEPAGSIS